MPENWGKRYQALPHAERLAVLSSVMAVEAEERAQQASCIHSPHFPYTIQKPR